MKRLKVNELEINRINDKSVGKWNKDDILLTNKNPLIPVTIPTFEWNVSSPMLTKDEFNSLALIIPERFLNYINVTYSDSTNVKIANITAKEGYVITKGQTEYRKVYNLYAPNFDCIRYSNLPDITVKDLVDMFPSMVGSDGYLTYNEQAVNYLNSLKPGGRATVRKNLTKWKDDALSGLRVYNFYAFLQNAGDPLEIPNKGVLEIDNYRIDVSDPSNGVLRIPYIGVRNITLEMYSIPETSKMAGIIPNINYSIDKSISEIVIDFGTIKKSQYNELDTEYNFKTTRFKHYAGQKITLSFSDGDVVIK